MSIHALHCPIQHYAWGSTSSIPQITGHANAENTPWAEMWIGAHPKASSSLHSGQSLAAFLQERGDSPLPFLFKILAAENALSIQCHPDKGQAEAGFAKEERAWIAIDAKNRNYRDRNHKPELIVALSEFWALKGFRKSEDIVALFGRAGVSAAGKLLQELHSSGLERFFTGLLALDDATRTSLLGELAAGLSNLPPDEARWTRELLSLYPGDIGACAALFLELVRLQPGDALFLGPGELHAYLSGTGLELMASSDNVLRGGLTPKHVDPSELSAVLAFQSLPLEVLRPQQGPAQGLQYYRTPAPDFRLQFADLLPGESIKISPQSDQLLLCIGGSSQITTGGRTVSLSPGQAAFCTRDTTEYLASGDGRLWIASTGL